MKKLTTLLIAAVIVALVGGVCLWLFVFRKVDHRITINLDGGVVVFSDNTRSELTEKLYQSSNEDQKIELGVAFEKSASSCRKGCPICSAAAANSRYYRNC